MSAVLGGPGDACHKRHLDLDASTRRQDHHDTYSTISDGRAMDSQRQKPDQSFLNMAEPDIGSLCSASFKAVLSGLALFECFVTLEFSIRGVEVNW